MAISLESLRELAGRAIMRVTTVTVGAGLLVEVLPENFDRLAWIVTTNPASAAFIGIGYDATDAKGIELGSGVRLLSLDHAAYGPMVCHRVTAFSPGIPGYTVTAHELVLIK